MNRILVVDDDQSIVKALHGYLEQAGYEVMRAYDGETALHILRRERPDLLILDLMLPDRDGWDITRILRNDPHLSAMPIIMLTARVSDADKVVGLELGADDYITKPFNMREVIARVRALLRRANLHGTPSQSVLQVGQIRLLIDQHAVIVAGVPIELTPTEFKLLFALMENPGFTLTRDELLEKSVGFAYEGMARTLDTHMRNLRKKIETGDEKYIHTVYGIGYRLVMPTEKTA